MRWMLMIMMRSRLNIHTAGDGTVTKVTHG